MFTLVRAWILLSALLVGAGWILSAVHQLNRVGYGIVFALAAGAFFCWQRQSQWRLQKSPAQLFHKFRQRFVRPAPLLFLILAAATFAGGALYLPANGDSNAYRIPRVLHWLGAGQWHWIHTGDLRMNIAGCGFEWLAAPLILFTHSYRFMFLINWISLLLLPGLIFDVFTRLDVRPRVAWWWMWLLSSGWCYVFQAETDINDSFAVIYALGSVSFALRARAGGRMADWWFSLLCAALLTGAKQTCIPLVALWGIMVWPGLRPMWLRPGRTLAIVAVAVLVSALPLIAINLHQAGNWMGMPSRAADTTGWAWNNTTLDSPFWGIIGNTFCLTVQNLKPPIFPWASAWNDAMQHFTHTPAGAHFASFENFARLDNSTGDSNAGIGLGVCLMTLLSLAWARKLKSAPGVQGQDLTDRRQWWLRLAPWGVLLLFMAKVGTYQNARQMAPYYVFLFPSLLVASGHSRLVRKIAWQWLVYAVMAVTILLLILSRGKQLFPAQTLFGRLHEKYPHSRIVARLAVSFSTPTFLRTQQTAFQNDLPPGETTIGYYTTFNCTAEPGLWQPLGSRRIERVIPGDSPAELRRKPIHYVVVDEQALLHSNQTIGEWLKLYDAELVKEVAFMIQWEQPPHHLYLVRLH
jgi:hypothetical protein